MALPQPDREQRESRSARIAERVRAIPEGFVRTYYGDIDPGAPRLVGRGAAGGALHRPVNDA
jgi:alkylated DNA nucleotide flippase Atl1